MKENKCGEVGESGRTRRRFLGPNVVVEICERRGEHTCTESASEVNHRRVYGNGLYGRDRCGYRETERRNEVKKVSRIVVDCNIQLHKSTNKRGKCISETLLSLTRKVMR